MKKGIVISGLPGAGKGILAKKLGEKLGWKVFSVGDLWRLKYKESGFKGTFEEFWKEIDIEKQKAMDDAARKMLEKGDAIGEFRYTKSCDGLDCLVVFVSCDLDKRAERAREIGKYGKKDEDEIKCILKKREEDEVNVGKEIYGDNYDYRNPINYSIILDSGELSIDEEVRIVIGLAEGKSIKELLKGI
jgi:cytidylate kinase